MSQTKAPVRRRLPSIADMAAEQLTQLRAQQGAEARVQASLEAAKAKAAAAVMGNAERRALLKAQLEEEQRP